MLLTSIPGNSRLRRESAADLFAAGAKLLVQLVEPLVIGADPGGKRFRRRPQKRRGQCGRFSRKAIKRSH